MSSVDAEFLEAIRGLHREKNAMYRDAWKKRGEVLSILANIARKVDRLEHMLDGAPGARDESLLDTAIDLFVYCLKYESFLADLDTLVAEALFGRSGLNKPYSEGTDGFQYLLSLVNASGFEFNCLTVHETASRVIIYFSKLEACFSGINTTHPATSRLTHAQSLVDATLNLIEAIRREEPALYFDFIASRSGGSS